MSRGEQRSVAVDHSMLREVRSLAIRILSPLGVTIYLFGSWARGDQRRTSDIDIAVDAVRPLPATALSQLREALEESTIPYRVQVIDLSEVDAAFRDRVRREGVRWTDSANA